MPGCRERRTLGAKKIRLELALGALAGGRFRFTQIDIDHAVARHRGGRERDDPDDIRADLAGLADRVAFDRLDRQTRTDRF